MIADEDLLGGALLPLPRAITILGAPVEAGASVPGAAMGPAMLRTAGIVQTLRDLGHDVEDRGDLAVADPLVGAGRREGRGARGRARGKGASVRRGRGLDAAPGARNLRGRPLRADSRRARRRSQPGY